MKKGCVNKMQQGPLCIYFYLFDIGLFLKLRSSFYFFNYYLVTQIQRMTRLVFCAVPSSFPKMKFFVTFYFFCSFHMTYIKLNQTLVCAGWRAS